MAVTCKLWRPYEQARYAAEAVFLSARWRLLGVLQSRFFSTTVTLGEVLLLCAIIVVYAAGYISGIMWRDIIGTGVMLNYLFFFTFLTACRNSALTFLLGLPFERALFWHKLGGYLLVIFGVMHAYIAIEKVGFDINNAGIPMLSAAILLSVTSLPPIRRHVFEFFMYNHMVLMLVAATVAVMHGVTLAGYGFLAYALDLVIRLVYSSTRTLREATLECLPAQVLRLTFPAAAFPRYKGGQYVFIAIPELSIFQWHPFSISSAPHEPVVSIHIRVLGNWTLKLQQLAVSLSLDGVSGGGGDGGGDGGDGELKVVRLWIDGPYGEPCVDIESERYKCVLMVSGGIGITPLQSICNQLLEQHTRGRPLIKVWFVWAVRDRLMVRSVGAVSPPPPRPHPMSSTAAATAGEDSSRGGGESSRGGGRRGDESSGGGDESRGGGGEGTFTLPPLVVGAGAGAGAGVGAGAGAPDAAGDVTSGAAAAAAAVCEISEEESGRVRLPLSFQPDLLLELGEALSGGGGSKEGRGVASVGDAVYVGDGGGGDGEEGGGGGGDRRISGSEIGDAEGEGGGEAGEEEGVEVRHDTALIGVDERDQEGGEGGGVVVEAGGRQRGGIDWGEVVCTQFYLTQARRGEGGGYVDASIDPSTQRHLKFGRPNLPHIFSEMAAIAGAAGQTRVAVLTCGPAGMVNDVERCCVELSRGGRHGVTFDLHSETFNL